MRKTCYLSLFSSTESAAFLNARCRSSRAIRILPIMVRPSSLNTSKSAPKNMVLIPIQALEPGTRAPAPSPAAATMKNRPIENQMNQPINLRIALNLVTFLLSLGQV